MITVKGVEVRSQEVDLKVDFQDLTAEGQKRVFLENKENFVQDALNSEYPAVQEVIWEVRNQCSAKVLNAAVVGYNEKRKSENYILDLLNVPDFQPDEETRELLGTRGAFHSVKVWVARDEKTSLNVLEKMFRGAANRYFRYNEAELLDAILTNPNFGVCEIQQWNFSYGQQNRIKARIKELKLRK